MDISGVAKREGKIRVMKCPKCEKAMQQHKIGKTKAGSQRFRCYFCKCSYTPTKKVQGYGKAIREKAIKMYVDGIGLRRTGRQLGLHHQSVANWAKEHAEQLPKAPVPDEVKVAEFDEIFTFIGDKKIESILLHL
jgi:transposase-like protein